MGFGRIGREMAKKARAFNMKILYHDKIQFPREVEEEYGAEYAPLHKLLTFNSIEWILNNVRSCRSTRLNPFTFNSIEWILDWWTDYSTEDHYLLSIPLNGFLDQTSQPPGENTTPFNSIEWILGSPAH